MLCRRAPALQFPGKTWRQYGYMSSRNIGVVRFFLLSSLLLIALRSQAAPTIDGHILGIHESDLRVAFDSVQRLRVPMIGPHGLRGVWVLPDTPVAGQSFLTTFFMKDKLVSRIEQQWTSTERQCANPVAFSNVLSTMKEKYGVGVTTSYFVKSDTQQQSTVWEAGAFDVLTHLLQSPAQCSVRVIYKPHETKDASAL